MRRGFVLLEVLISTLIAGFISTGLLITIFQINRVQQTVNTLSSVYGRLAILQNQMERDVMGAFVPAQIDVVQTSTAKKEQIKPLEKVFYGKSKGDGGRLDILTFITSNPLQIFFGVKDVKIKPHAARVVYRVVPDEKRKNSYVLFRQEGTSNLLFDAYTRDAQGEFRSFPMIDGIQNLTVQFVSIEQEKAEEKTHVKRIYKRTFEWQSEQKKEQEKKPQLQKKEPVKLPHQLEIEVSLWDSVFESARSFKLTIPIAYKASEYEQPPIKKEEQKKDEQKDAKRLNNS